MRTGVGPVSDENEETEERDPGQTNRFGSLGGAKPKRPKFELPDPRTPGPHRMSPGDRLSFEMPTPMYPGPGRQPLVPGQGR